jgi:Major capsid protein 13-like
MTTRITDVIQPEVFNPYVVQRTMELSALVQSGIVQNSAEFDSLASGPNTLVNMPFWNDLTGDSEIMMDSGALTPGKIGSNKDVARKHGRARAWAANGLSALLSGDDPLGAIANLVSSYWAREMQKILLATLNGVFASSSMSGHVHDISAETGDAALISGETFIDAVQKLGDAKELLTGVMMHSAVEAYLAKRQLIEYVQEAGQSDRVGFFLNKRVIVDDSMPYDTATKTGVAYLFGQGAVALGNGSHPRIIETEVDRDSLASSGEDYLINRRIFILHPRGIKWTENTVADVFPTNAELSNGANWERVYEPKAIRIVKFKFKIG